MSLHELLTKKGIFPLDLFEKLTFLPQNYRYTPQPVPGHCTLVRKWSFYTMSCWLPVCVSLMTTFLNLLLLIAFALRGSRNRQEKLWSSAVTMPFHLIHHCVHSNVSLHSLKTNSCSRGLGFQDDAIYCGVRFKESNFQIFSSLESVGSRSQDPGLSLRRGFFLSRNNRHTPPPVPGHCTYM